MSDPVAALGGARFEGFVTVEELAPRGMIAVRADLSDTSVATVVADIAGTSMPGPLQAAGANGRAVCWMSPDECLLMCEYRDAPELAAQLQGAAGDAAHILVADVSDARSVFRLHGSGLHDVLAKLTPADMSPAAFPPGSFRRTRLAQVPAALWKRQSEMAEVLCFRSVAAYAFALLSNAATPGAEVDYWRT